MSYVSVCAKSIKHQFTECTCRLYTFFARVHFHIVFNRLFFFNPCTFSAFFSLYGSTLHFVMFLVHSFESAIIIVGSRCYCCFCRYNNCRCSCCCNGFASTPFCKCLCVKRFLCVISTRFSILFFPIRFGLCCTFAGRIYFNDRVCSSNCVLSVLLKPLACARKIKLFRKSCITLLYVYY